MRASAYTYDGAGQLLTATDPRGNVTRYAYDAKGNLASVDALDHVLQKTQTTGAVTLTMQRSLRGAIRGMGRCGVCK